MENLKFIDEIAPLIAATAPEYGILCNSAVIAQAILESGWGFSTLASFYHNYFGLKCGTLWTGKSVNMTTKEEYTPGHISTIKDNFRVYDDMEDGVKGYFEFIQLPRYSNLRGIQDPETYLRTIWQDGYATSSTYVSQCMDLVNQYNLRQYDTAVEESIDNGVTADDVIRVANGWVGKNEYDGSHRAIIDIYNNHKPLAVNYALSYSDDWCDAFVSAVYIVLEATELIGGTECGVERHINLFKAAGIWQEDGTVIPKPGWPICFHWGKNSQPNDGFGSHIGIVKSCDGRTITYIEGNNNDDAVGINTVPVGDGHIRGFAMPRFAASSKPVQTPEAPVIKPSTDLKQIASEVIDGEWGNGEERMSRLRAAGYDPDAIQSIVNSMVSNEEPDYDFDEVAYDVIDGCYGNDPERTRRLKEAGYDPKAVQKRVNELLS